MYLTRDTWDAKVQDMKLLRGCWVYDHTDATKLAEEAFRAGQRDGAEKMREALEPAMRHLEDAMVLVRDDYSQKFAPYICEVRRIVAQALNPTDAVKGE